MIVHVELGEQVPSLIWKIKSLGKKVGLAINPPTAITAVQPYLDQIDLLLVMTVNPGFGGQEFIHETLPKIQQAEAWRREKNLPIASAWTVASTTRPPPNAPAPARTPLWPAQVCSPQRSLKVAVNKMRKIVNANDPALADLAV
jgi:ribulose-phosphate 3-epimerase